MKRLDFMEEGRKYVRLDGGHVGLLECFKRSDFQAALHADLEQRAQDVAVVFTDIYGNRRYGLNATQAAIRSGYSAAEIQAASLAALAALEPEVIEFVDANPND